MTTLLLVFYNNKQYKLTDESFIYGSGFFKEALDLSGDTLPVFDEYDDIFFKHYTNDSIIELSYKEFIKLISFWEYIAYYEQINVQNILKFHYQKLQMMRWLIYINHNVLLYY